MSSDEDVRSEISAHGLSDSPFDGPDGEIFEGTPLAGYLEDTGVADWGIESMEDKEVAFAGSGDFRRRVLGGANVPLPLVLSAASEEGRGSARELRRQRFLSLIRNAVNPRLKEQENSKFLERFRYIFISSQLLEPHSSVTMLTADELRSRLTDRKHNILFGDEGPWNTLKMHSKYWVGGGGCIVVITVLLNWQAKKSNQSTKDAAAGVVIVLCVMLFWFAHSRRRTLRMIRSKSIAHASHFVDRCQAFDGTISRCLLLIQEIELLSLGYRPDLATESNYMAPSRITANHALHTRTAKRLRSAVSAALYLGITGLLDAIKDAVKYCSELDLQRYFDIYELQSSQAEFGFVMNDDYVGFTGVFKDDFYGSQGASAPLKRLRREFHRLRFLRKAFICCLLSVWTSGECTRQEFSQWSTVIDHLELCSGLLLQLSLTLSKDTLLPEEPTMEEQVVVDGEHAVRRSHMNKLAAALQRVDARIHLLQDDIDFHQNYQLIGQDIEELLDTWKTRDHIKKPKADFRRHAPSASTSTLMTLVDDRFEESSVISNSPDDIIFGQDMVKSQYDPIGGERVSVLEAVVEDDGAKMKPSIVVSREVRIQTMKQNREHEAHRKAVAAQRCNFVLELGNVLDKRRQAYQEEQV
jgi:hypothetical protein